MVTLKKLLLLMSVMPSVTILAMDSSLASSKPSKTNVNVDNNNNDSEQDRSNPTSSVTSSVMVSPIVSTASVKMIFSPQTFNADGFFSPSEWAELSSTLDNHNNALSVETKKKVVENKIVIPPSLTWKDTLEDKSMIMIPDEDTPHVKKRSKDNLFSIRFVYKQDKVPPTILVDRYAQDDPDALAVYSSEQRVKNGLRVNATAINEQGSFAVYADTKNNLHLYSTSRDSWINEIRLKHYHGAFEKATPEVQSEVKEEKKEEEKVELSLPFIKSLTFIEENVLAIRTPKCIQCIYINESGYEHIRCFEAPEEGTGTITGPWLGGMIPARKYAYQFIKEVENKEKDPIDSGILRTYSGTRDHFDRISLNYSLNQLHSPQITMIWLIGTISKITKDNFNKSTMTPLLKVASSDKCLKPMFPYSVRTHFKNIVQQKADDLGVSLK